MIAALFLATAQAMTFKADRIAADVVTHALVATGNLAAASGPLTIRGESMTRDAEGVMLFSDPVYATTCTNEIGHTHWNVTGEIEVREHDYVVLRNAWVKFCEFPILWLPYLYYPLDTSCGFRWMPGYTGRWGAYLLTMYSYDLIAPSADDGGPRLGGATRFDMRSEQGLAVGEDLDWDLGDFGSGRFDIYYAWDNTIDDLYSSGLSPYYGNLYNWVSQVDRDRYSIGFSHRLEPTERDMVWITGSYFSDSMFRHDFVRRTMFNWKAQFQGYDNSGVYWEHVENMWAFGVEASGRLNDFYGSTCRLPEIYLDVVPQPLFGLPVNYETENRIGYLKRDPAELGAGDWRNPYNFNPGVWARYEAFRFDTYHRLSAPFRTADDVLAVTPRIGYHGTYWGGSGRNNLSGWGESADAGAATRSIAEGGVTFAARGTAWIDERWKHVIEPYLDLLAQEAWYSGIGDEERPYVFDNIDASVMWEDQFAGRARNLPYSYFGMTPGLRNAWEKADDRGSLRQVLDLDLYVALQIGGSDFKGSDDAHRLAEAGDPNYGKRELYLMPGFRMRWTPTRDLSLMARAEYDPDHNTLASSDVMLRYDISKDLKFDVRYASRDFRVWDFSSAPYDPDRMTEDGFNYMRAHFINVGLEHHPIDWLAWGPYLRWDIRDNELDGVGTWIDYLTDCLGFRLILEYQNAYTWIDGYEREDDWTIGFYVYLRAFGADNKNLLMH